jgi:peptide-methionine (R)-S-oxide reductase
MKHQDQTTVANDKPRRVFLLTAGAALVALAWSTLRRPAAAKASESAAPVTIVPVTASGKLEAPVAVPKVIKTEADWKKQLDATQFAVARNEGTERPFTGATWNNHEDGVYRCVCCDTAVYDSKTKFESGTGWPSFWEPIAKQNVTETRDTSFLMVRTAVSCTRCDAHLGHVFDDGPKPTGLRYCMNSAAMKFVKRA